MIIGRAGPPPTSSGRRPSETSEMERLLRPLGEWQEPRRNLGDEDSIFGERGVVCAADGAIGTRGGVGRWDEFQVKQVRKYLVNRYRVSWEKRFG